MKVETVVKILRRISRLSKKERKVIVTRFGLDDGEPKTLEQVGLEMWITKERVRQIEGKALTKLYAKNSTTE